MPEYPRPIDPALADAMTLAEGCRGFAGVILAVRVKTDASHALDPDELERRLLEIGFVEGARVEILHEGFLGRDPILVRLDDTRVALRRREAGAILVRQDPSA